MALRYQMDWGFVRVEGWDGGDFKIACFAMVCHHCGTCYVEFFPNARRHDEPLRLQRSRFRARQPRPARELGKVQLVEFN